MKIIRLADLSTREEQENIARLIINYNKLICSVEEFLDEATSSYTCQGGEVYCLFNNDSFVSSTGFNHSSTEEHRHFYKHRDKLDRSFTKHIETEQYAGKVLAEKRWTLNLGSKEAFRKFNREVIYNLMQDYPGAVIFSQIRTNNTKALAFSKSTGFKPVGIIPHSRTGNKVVVSIKIKD